MISDLERYQGVALRRIIIGAGAPVLLGVMDGYGRVDSFVVNHVGIHVKYSTKRMSPWPFTFTLEQIREVAELGRRCSGVWILLVCGVDGVVGLLASEFAAITDSSASGLASLRVSRRKGGMYHVSGSAGPLPEAKPNWSGDFVRQALSVPAKVLEPSP